MKPYLILVGVLAVTVAIGFYSRGRQQQPSKAVSMSAKPAATTQVSEDLTDPDRRKEGGVHPEVEALLAAAGNASVSTASLLTPDTWRTANFIPISDLDKVRQTVQSAPVILDADVTPEQEANLRDAAIELLMMHADGTSEAYLKFASRTPTKPVAEQLGSTMDEWKMNIERFWRHAYNGEGMWTGISPDSMSMRVYKASKRVMINEDLSVLSRPNQGIGYQVYPYLVPVPTTEEEIKKTGSVLYADITVLMQHRVPDPAYPYCIRMRWHPESKVWVMDQAAYMYSGPRKYTIAF